MSSAYNDFFTGIKGFTYKIAFAGSSIASFTENLISGGPVIQGFLSRIEQLSTSVLDYSTKAFTKASENEINRLAAGGAISNSFDKKISFDDGLSLFDEIKVKLAKSAASLPGTTSDYITVFRSLSDDMATALNSSKMGGKQLSNLFREKVPKAVENLVLQTKLYGQDIPVSSITKTYSKLLSTGKVNAREIFVQRNPVLRTSIEKWEKDNGKKLSSLNIRERFEALNKIFGDSISPQQFAGLTESFQAKVETLKSFLFDPDIGFLGFERKFKGLDGKDTTMFESLAKVIGPVIEGFASLAQNLIKFGDPLQGANSFIEKMIGPSVEAFVSNMNLFNSVFQTTEGAFETRLQTALKTAFNFDYKTFDYSGAIDKFFNFIAKGIEDFGKNLKPGDEFSESINSLLGGFFKVLSAIVSRASQAAASNPIAAFQFVAVTNPGLIFQGIIALMTTVAALGPIIGFLAPVIGAAVSAVGSAILAITPVFVTSLVGIASLFTSLIAAVLAVVAFFVGIAVFNKELSAWGKSLQSWGQSLGGWWGKTVESFGLMTELLGEAGAALKSFWDNLMSGNWTAAIGDLVKAIGYTVLGALNGLGGLTLALTGAIGEVLKVLGDGFMKVITWIGTGLSDLWKSLLQTLGRPFNGDGIKSMSTIVEAPAGDVLGQIKNTVIDRPMKYWFGNAEGNSFGNLLATINTESRAMPSGASVTIANTSEAIIPRDKAMNMLQKTNKGSYATVNIYANTNASAQDIAYEVRQELNRLFEDI
jgi:hypothetical protein